MEFYGGIMLGLVTNVNDPDGAGRIQVSFPTMEGAPTSAWAHIVAPLAGPLRGAFLMPEVGDNAIVAFDRGDFAYPYVLGSYWDGVFHPPETNLQNRVFITPGEHTLRFEDGDPKKVILRSSGNNEVLLDDTAGASQIRLRTAGGLVVKMSDADSSIELNGGGRILALRGGIVQIS
jgi:uncharacterized protein involved in type VI secretion and phage assembly